MEPDNNQVWLSVDGEQDTRGSAEEGMREGMKADKEDGTEDGTENNL